MIFYNPHDGVNQRQELLQDLSLQNRLHAPRQQHTVHAVGLNERVGQLRSDAPRGWRKTFLTCGLPIRYLGIISQFTTRIGTHMAGTHDCEIQDS